MKQIIKTTTIKDETTVETIEMPKDAWMAIIKDRQNVRGKTAAGQWIVSTYDPTTQAYIVFEGVAA